MSKDNSRRRLCPHRLLMSLVIAAMPFSVAASDQCGQLVSDSEINDCATAVLAEVDSELEATYRYVLSGLDEAGKEEPSVLDAKAELIEAQRHWSVFREADCEPIFTLNQGGSIRISAYLFCMTDHAKLRKAQLEAAYATYSK